MCIKNKINLNKRKKVFVGLSGGVDSSVSAYLLKKRGYDVVGVFIRVWQPDNTDCTWKNEKRDASRVAAFLNIPFYVLDLREEYKKDVFDYMIHGYENGIIPNPDVMCNKFIKFGAFYKFAIANNADFVATGHYAISEKGILYKGMDNAKDQSYFLWTLKEDILKNTIFPIGHLQKSEVRKIAKKANIPVFDKKDSQGVCFIGHIDMKEFLKSYIDLKIGDVYDIHGNIIGKHDGVILYTLGARHGFYIHKQNTNQKPLYVIKKDKEKNILIVSDNYTENKYSKNKFKLTDIYIRNNYKENNNNNELYAQIRYHGKFEKIIYFENDIIEFENKIYISIGQSIVLYKKNICLGGGIVIE